MMWRFGGIAVLIVLAGLLWLWRGGASPPPSPKESDSGERARQASPSPLPTRDDDRGGVVVSITPTVLEEGRAPEFQVTFNTHSVELSFDVASQSSLVDAVGNVYRGATWEGDPPGGHHRSGRLTFSEKLRKTSFVELVVARVGGVEERRFRWEL